MTKKRATKIYHPAKVFKCAAHELQVNPEAITKYGGNDKHLFMARDLIIYFLHTYTALSHADIGHALGLPTRQSSANSINRVNAALKSKDIKTLFVKDNYKKIKESIDKL